MRLFWQYGKHYLCWFNLEKHKGHHFSYIVVVAISRGNFSLL